MRLGFFLHNESIPDVDLTQPWLGNPGIGGTEYRFAMLPWAITEFGTGQHSAVILAPNTQRLPTGVPAEHCADLFEAPAICARLGLDALVFRPWDNRAELQQLADSLASFKIAGIGWAGNALDAVTFDLFARHPAFKAYVSVGREIIDYFRDLDIIYKSVCIFNGLRTEGIGVKTDFSDDPKIVMYLGSLFPAKGFHRLAHLWPQILAAHPDAKLHVLGSGKVYDRSAELGPFGLAEADYEARFIPPLLDEAGQLHSSVHFHGLVGIEKYDLMRGASIGVVNPTGQTETFCASAVEFQLVGVPVVSAAEWGLLDTVVHNRTGLLCRTDKEIVDAITKLLDDVALRKKMGMAGATFARENFSFECAVRGWERLMTRIESGEAIRHLPPKSNLMYRKKWLKEALRVAKRIVPPWRTLPPIGGRRLSYVVRDLLLAVARPKAWVAGWTRNPEASITGKQ